MCWRERATEAEWKKTRANDRAKGQTRKNEQRKGLVYKQIYAVANIRACKIRAILPYELCPKLLKGGFIRDDLADYYRAY